MDLIVPNWKGVPAHVGAMSTCRSGGVSAPPYGDGMGGGGLNLGTHVGDDPARVLENRALLRTFLPAEPAWLTQVHGNRVVEWREAQSSGQTTDADACIAVEPGAVCVIQTADCLPVLFSDTAGTVVGAAHAGWRGLANGVLDRTAARMREVGAAELIAWLGPAIGPQCFEVGRDVFDAFVDADAEASSAFRPVPGVPGKYLADIYDLARRRLAACGIQRVFGGGMCTVTDSRRFYSYRRDKITGRMASLIWLKQDIGTIGDDASLQRRVSSPDS